MLTKNKWKSTQMFQKEEIFIIFGCRNGTKNLGTYMPQIMLISVTGYRLVVSNKKLEDLFLSYHPWLRYRKLEATVFLSRRYSPKTSQWGGVTTMVMGTCTGKSTLLHRTASARAPPLDVKNTEPQILDVTTSQILNETAFKLKPQGKRFLFKQKMSVTCKEY